MGVLQSVLSQVFPQGIELSSMQLLDVACVSLMSDGGTTNEESGWLANAIDGLPGFVGMSFEKREQVVVDALQRYRERESFEAALKGVVRSLTNTAQKEQAFAIAAAVQHADNELQDGENDLLLALVEALEIAEDRANAILSQTEEIVAASQGE